MARAAAGSRHRRAWRSFSGIPGSIGGALRMNAGCYGGETKDVLIEACGVDRHGQRAHAEQCRDGLSPIATAALPDDVIFTAALFQGRAGDPDADRRRHGARSRATREATPADPRKDRRLDVQEPARPQRLAAGRRRRLARAAVGGAKSPPLHANFLINTGEATAADLERLGETVRAA